VYSCFRYDSVCRDGLLERESERCHALSWSNKHAWVAPRASWRASVPVHSLISKFLQQHLSVPCAIICKVSDMSAKICLLPTTASNMLDDTLAIRKRLCCLLRVCVETVVSILFWWFNKGILLLVSTNYHVAWLCDNFTICGGAAVHFACLRCWEKCCW